MPKIETDNKDVEKTLSAICATLEENGAYVAPFLTIRCEGGNLCLLSDEENVKGPIIRLPPTLTPRYDQFSFAIEGNDIVLKDYTDKVTPLQVMLTEKMLDLYNLTGKTQTHRETCPWLVFKDSPEILELLFQARQGEEYEKLENFLHETESEDDLILKTFFNTILLGRRLKGKTVPVFMPVIDFANYHIQGAPYNHTRTKQGEHIHLSQAKPVTGSKECFALYGRLDALDTYISYNFVDKLAPFIRSVPIEIDLGDTGKIVISALNAYLNKADIPEPLRDLRFYFPTIDVYHAKKTAVLSHIYIPQDKACFSMRRILDFVILLLDPDVDQDVRTDSLLEVERQILKKNDDFYKSLNNALLNSKINSARSQNLFDVIKEQSEKIQIYQTLVKNAV